MPTERQLTTVKVNKLSNDRYSNIQKSPDQLYLTPNETRWFDNITGTILDTQIILSNEVMVFKNGKLLRLTTAYTISGSIITFTDALVSTDEIAVRL